MSEIGKRTPACGIDAIGLSTKGTVRYNFGAAELAEEAIRRGEARLSAHGALVADTGQHTGRSPKDKFVVRDAATEGKVWWGNNKAITPAQFETLLADFRAHAADKDLYVQDLIGGADRDARLVRADGAVLEGYRPRAALIAWLKGDAS